MFSINLEQPCLSVDITSYRGSMTEMREVMKAFSGEGDSDVSTWLKKVKLVAKIKKVNDLENFIPLYLEGAAFAVYDQMSDGEKEKGDSIEKVLLEAFAQKAFSAYDSFRQRSWCPGEPVDVYMSDLRRLARLARIENDELLRCAFVCGLPQDISAQLRASAKIEKASLPTILEQARVYLSERIHGSAMVACGRSKEDPSTSPSAFRTAENKDNRKKMSCYNCGGDHPVCFCKEKKNVSCWNCGLAHLLC